MRIIIDYIPAVECKNEKVLYICHKCGKCGREFYEGILIYDGGTHIEDEEEDDD